jgi:hypothetical protein
MKLQLFYPIVKRKKSKKELISFFLFLVILSLFWPFFSRFTAKQWQTVITIFSAICIIAVSIALYRASLSLFTSALFFVLLFFLMPVVRIQRHLMRIHFPGVNYLVIFSAYFIIVLFFRKFRSHVKWLKLGRFDRVTLFLSIIVTALSSGSLILWTLCAHPDLSETVSMIPQLSPLWLVAGGMGFAVLNSFTEELIFRGFVQSGLMISRLHWVAALLLQAVCFGLWHFNGVPGGFSGSLLVFAWGAVLGMIRYRTGGILAPIAMHFCADLTIFFILISVMG